ncbi:MAG: prepilin-type N-terminal cleavage/methylation domain-containing protein [Candidatus Omnitrophota bacterium]
MNTDSPEKFQRNFRDLVPEIAIKIAISRGTQINTNLSSEFIRENSCAIRENSCISYAKINNKKALTLLELIIAVSLLGVIILAATTFDTAIRQSFRHSDVQVQLLTEISPALQHMTKNIMQGIGDVSNPGINMTNVAGNLAVRVRTNIGLDNQIATIDDEWRAYRYTGSTGPPIDDFQIWYYLPYFSATGAPGLNANDPHEIISRRVFNATFIPLLNNSIVGIDITACQDPNEGDVNGDGTADPCGSRFNPSVNIATTISLRAASSN